MRKKAISYLLPFLAVLLALVVVFRKDWRARDGGGDTAEAPRHGMKLPERGAREFDRLYRDGETLMRQLGVELQATGELARDWTPPSSFVADGVAYRLEPDPEENEHSRIFRHFKLMKASEKGSRPVYAQFLLATSEKRAMSLALGMIAWAHPHHGVDRPNYRIDEVRPGLFRIASKDYRAGDMEWFVHKNIYLEIRVPFSAIDIVGAIFGLEGGHPPSDGSKVPVAHATSPSPTLPVFQPSEPSMSWRWVPHLLRRVSDDELSQVRTAFAELENAYTNGQRSTFNKLRQDMPDCVTNMWDAQYREFEVGLIKCIEEYFWEVDPERQFESPEEYDNYARINMEAVRFLGETWRKRLQYPPRMLLVLERETLRRLVMFQARFHSEGASDLEACARTNVQNWIDAIDSPDGMTRTIAFQEVDVNWKRVVKGEMSREDLYSFAEFNCLAGKHGLLSLGCRPKWLGELKQYCETKEIDRSGVDVCPP